MLPPREVQVCFSSIQKEIEPRGDYGGVLLDDLRATLAEELCSVARTAIEENVSLAEAISRSDFLGRYEKDRELLETLGQLAFVSFKLKELASRSLIVVRGYADSERWPWERELNPPGPRILVHPLDGPPTGGDDYGLRFGAEMSTVVLGQAATNRRTYGNEDLPDLRGAEVARILSKIVDACSPKGGVLGPGQVRVEILQGHVFGTTSEDDRRARVHLIVYLRPE